MKTLAIKSILAIILLLLLLAIFMLQRAPENQEVWKVYYLGGQSNMTGYGYTKQLPAHLKSPLSNIMIYDGKRVNGDNEGAGIWEELQPGHGRNFETDGRVNYLSNRFGPELSFADTLGKNGDRIALIKYSYRGSSLHEGASSLGSWDPDASRNNHYDNALATITNALKVDDINGDGRADKLVPAGIIWMQGEADAYHSNESAQQYQANLERLIMLLRRKLQQDNLPVVIGKINDSHMMPDGSATQPYIGLVHAAQENVTNNDECAIYVHETDSYSFSKDAWHYTSDGYVKMGTAFAKAVMQLEKPCEKSALW